MITMTVNDIIEFLVDYGPDNDTNVIGFAVSDDGTIFIKTIGD